MAGNDKFREILNWGQLAVIVALIGVIITAGSSLSTALKEKANIADLNRVEEQSIARDRGIKTDFQRTADRIDTRFKESNELLIKIIERMK